MEGLVAPAVCYAILFGIAGLVFLYKKVSRNGRALHENDLPREIYEVIYSCEHKKEKMVLLRNAKGQVLSCCVPLSEGFKLFSENEHFFVPAKYSLNFADILLGTRNFKG